MAGDVSGSGAGAGFPAWAAAATAAAGIKAKAGDCHEDVAVADIDGDPFSIAFFSVVEKSA